MKKLIFLVMLLLGAVLGVQAQKRSIYQGEVNLGLTCGFWNNKMAGVSLQTVQGARIGDHFSVGGGLGIEAVLAEHSCKEEAPYECNHALTGLVLPVFVNFKGYLNASKRTTGYISLDAGLTPHLDDDRVRASLYLCPSIGVKTRRFKADLGYKFINKFNGFQLRFGVFLGGGKQRKEK